MTSIKVVNFNYKNYLPNSIIINTTSRSDNWSRGLSPFLVGPIHLYDGYISQNMENAWQYYILIKTHIDIATPSDGTSI